MQSPSSSIITAEDRRAGSECPGAAINRSVTNWEAGKNRNLFSHLQEVRSPKSQGASRAASLKALWEDPSCLCEPLVAPGRAWLVTTSLQSLPQSSHDLLPVSCLSPNFPLLNVHQLYWVRAHPTSLTPLPHTHTTQPLTGGYGADRQESNNQLQALF